MRENGCYDCATCTGRMELDLGGGRTPREMELLAQTCADCSHLYRRHMHASLRRGGLMKMAGVRFHVDPPPQDSRLGQLLVELGQYDDYYRHIRRDMPSEEGLMRREV